MKRTLLWVAACLLPLTGFSQTALEQTIKAAFSTLKTPGETGGIYLPGNSRFENFEKDGSSLTVNLNIPVDFLDRELDALMVDEIMERFAAPLSDFGVQTVFVKAQNEFGLYFNLADFLDESFQVDAPARPNDDPSPARFGVKGVDSYSDVQPKGQLHDATIWLSAGHGWIHDKKRNGFKTQRRNHHGIVEDFSNIEWVNYHLLPYLYHAGANVWCVRERDMNLNEVIVDNDTGNGTYREKGNWSTSRTRGYESKTYRYAISGNSETAVAIFEPHVPESGKYWVSVRYTAGSNRSVDARYRIIHAGGVSKVSINQEVHGDTWVYLGQFYFEKGKNGRVVLSNASNENGQVIVADAVRFGGGVGTVKDCEYGGLSMEPRFEEGSKYYARYQGFPGCMNDVSIRPRFAEWELSKGDDTERSNAIYLSWHSNGSGASGTESYTHSYRKVKGSWSLQKYVHEQLIRDIRRGYDKNWRDRGKKSADFGELRGLKTMPGLLVEIGFHDNSSDARALSEPGFRNLTARATYKGIVQYFAKKQGRQPVYLPEPPTHLSAVYKGNRVVKVSWKASRHGGIYGHPAQGYKVYLSHHGRAFSSGVHCQRTSFTIEDAEPGKTYYLRVSAINKGGESFPSAVVAFRIPDRPSEQPDFLIVDGFDRLDRNQAVLVKEKQPRYAPLGTTRRLFLEQMNSYDYAVEHASAFEESGMSFDGATNEAVINGSVRLADYQGINWFLGRESDKDKTLGPKEQGLLKAYLDQGGKLIISGSEIGYDLVEKKNGPSFYKKYLKADFKGDDAKITEIAGLGNNRFVGLDGKLRDSEFGRYEMRSPDFIQPVEDSEAILQYSNGKIAAVAHKGSFSVVHFAFPLEAVESWLRNEIVRKSVQYLQEPNTDNTTGAEEETKLVTFPSSVKNQLTLQLGRLTEGRASLRLTTVMGNEILSRHWSHDGRSGKTFDLGNIPKGLINYEFEINGHLQVGYFRKE